MTPYPLGGDGALPPPVGRLKAAYLSFARAVETDADLKNHATVRVWRTEAGGRTRAVRPGPVPSRAQTPLVWIGPIGAPAEWFAEGQHYIPLGVQVQCHVVGGPDEALDLAERVIRAVYPYEQTRPERAAEVKRLLGPAEQVTLVDLGLPRPEGLAEAENEPTPDLCRCDLLFRLEVYLSTGE